jgi:hypothetical protein
MKRIKYLFILVILISACNTALNLKYLSDNKEDEPLSKFIIGRWSGEFQRTDESGIYKVQYELQFAEPNIMFYNRISPPPELHNILFLYKFIDENRIRIEGRVIDELIVIRESEYLDISSIHGFITDGRYSRLPVIDEWILISIFIGILSVGVLFMPPFRASYNSQEKDPIKGYLDRFEWLMKPLFYYALRIIITIIVFGIGVLIAIGVWNWLPLLSIRIPWDSIIMIELSIAVLISGTKTIRANRIGLGITHFSVAGWWYYFGVFMMGISLCGIIIGLMRLVVLLNFGSYMLD